jgi:hypothetical protein
MRQNTRHSLPERVIHNAFFFSIWVIARLHDMTPYHQKVADLRLLPAGSVGKELADYLLQRNLALVPGFESHDLKHLVLNYELEPLGEIRMQAFMLGNGNWTLPSMAIFLFGLLLLPRHLLLFWQDFRAGRECPAIAALTIEECEHYQLPELRKLIFNQYTKTALAIKPGFHAPAGGWGSYGLVGVGAAAMLFCYPFLWSANVADLVGAGFPFVAGAIFVVGGFVNLTLRANLSQKEVKT